MGAEGERPRPPKLGAFPLVEECSVTFEDLDATIRAVSHVYATLPIHRDAVRRVEFAGPVAFVAPVEDKLSFG